MQDNSWLTLHVAQTLSKWTLLGEYTGVWDSQEQVTQRIKDDPMGLGTMRRDKVTALGYTSEASKAAEDVQQGTPHICKPPSYEGGPQQAGVS